MTRMLILAGALMAVGVPALAQTGARTEIPIAAPVVINPAWISVQQPVYPAFARNSFVTTGFVKLQCTARASGAVDACEVLEETPGGQGFGQEALKVMPLARIRPRTIDGHPVDTRVIQSFRFVLQDAPASSRSVEAAAEGAGRSEDPPSS